MARPDELIRLGFDSVSDLLDEQLQEIQVELWPYQSPDFSKFLELKEKGSSPQAWFFRIRMRNRKTNLEENFVFRFYRIIRCTQRRKSYHCSLTGIRTINTRLC